MQAVSDCRAFAGRGERLLRRAIVGVTLLVLLLSSLPSVLPGAPSGALGRLPSHVSAPPMASHGVVTNANPPSPIAPAVGAVLTPREGSGFDPRSWAAFLGGAMRPGATNGTPSDLCFGVWPARGGQSLYPDECYGHDEPGFSAFSTLPGSAGNVSWTFTLPTDRGPTRNQSDLYATFWFGMVLSDAHSALGEAFLELQFYPDHLWTSPVTVNGEWIGQARVVQADLATGVLDDAYSTPLEIGGISGQYLSMHEGDTVEVNLTGWPGNPLGESLVVDDLTLGVTASHRLYNLTGGYPLNPSYSTVDFPDALEWTTTGAPAVSFSFETGHGINTAIPGNNSFGGCSPGAPPPTPANPAVPCPSYDPSSWANDTGQPLRVSLPVFWNGTTEARAAEVEFLNAGGGPSSIDPVSNGACLGRDGSAWCSYPWYSYSCQYHAFEFGATDYPETSADFGKYGQYSATPTMSSEQFQYYRPQRFVVPACGASTFHVDVGLTGPAGGTVQLLRENLSGPATVGGLLPGNYSLEATPGPGEAFSSWTGSNGVRVADPQTPWTSVEVSGNGSLTANFAPVGASVALTVSTSGCTGRVSVVAGIEYDVHRTPWTSSGGTVDLVPGIYTVQALADPGCAFAHWSWDSAGLRLADAHSLFTWIVVSARVSAVSLSAVLAPTAVATAVWLFFTGVPGTVTFNGVAYTNNTEVNLSAGTYPLTLQPTPGNPLPTVASGIAVNSLDLRASGNITLSPGPWHSLRFQFNQSVGIRVNGSSAGGRFWLAGSGPLPDGSIFPLEQPGPTAYPVLAFPPTGEAWAGWSSGPPGALWPDPPGTPDAVLANASGNLTAQFVPAPSVSLEVDIFLSHGGAVRLDEGPLLTNDSTTVPVAPGTHLIQPVPSAGYSFSGWGSLGTASVVAGGGPGPWTSGLDRLVVAAGSPILDAFFVPTTFPITFVSSPPGALATIGTTPVTNGVTISLVAGTYPVEGTLPSGGAIGGWTTSPGLSLVGTPGALSLVVTGPGSLYASGSGPLDGYVSASFSGAAAPVDVSFEAVALNGTPSFSFAWSFGDGASGTGASPVHTYGRGGAYVAVVWINDSASGSAERSLRLTIPFAPLVPQIVANRTAAIAPSWISFNGTATGGSPPYRFLWDFGDGVGAASGAAASYEFAVPGSYPVVLSVEDSVGTIANATQAIAVSPTPLTITILAAPTNLTVGGPLHVDVIVTGGWTPYSFLWNGLPPGCPAPASTGLICAPDAVGEFSISVRVTDAVGVNATADAIVHVLPNSAGSGTAPVGPLGLTYPDLLVLSLASAAVVLAIAAILLRQRRRSGSPPSPTPRGQSP